MIFSLNSFTKKVALFQICNYSVTSVGVVYHVKILVFENGLFKTFWPIEVGCVLRFAGSSLLDLSILQDKHGSTAEYYADRFHNFETLNVIQVSSNHGAYIRCSDVPSNISTM